jgi:hypothetical protein
MYTIMQSKRASPWAYGWLCFDAAMLHLAVTPRSQQRMRARLTMTLRHVLLPQPWTDFGTTAVLDSWCGDRFDARVSFGFKEMYCDSLEYDDDDTGDSQEIFMKSVETVDTPAPRLTVYKTLNTLFHDYAKARAKVSHAIVMFAHI